MTESHHVSILDHFADLDDPRAERTRRHQLVDIIAIAICATICGADSWVHIELFGQSKLEWFQTFLELPGGSLPTTPPLSRGQALWRCFCPSGSSPIPELLRVLDPGHRAIAARCSGGH